MKFKNIVSEWLTFYEGKVKGSTFLMYQQISTQLTKEFGEFTMKQITNLQLQQYLNFLHREHYAKSTINKYKITLNLIFKYYKKLNPNFKNPCDDLYLPKGALVKKREPLSNQDICTILKDYRLKEYLYPLFLLCFGLRRSEALALEWEDVDLDRKIITVNKTIEFIKNKPVLWHFLKNGEQEKIIPILPFIYEYIFELKNIYKTGIIFNNDGDYLLENQSNKLWKDFKIKSGINATQHQLRHTYATILYKSGVDLKTAMELLGHKNLKMLLEVYAHTDEAVLIKAVNVANEFLVQNYV